MSYLLCSIARFPEIWNAAKHREPNFFFFQIGYTGLDDRTLISGRDCILFFILATVPRPALGSSQSLIQW
jgi:hypothetical protein